MNQTLQDQEPSTIEESIGIASSSNSSSRSITSPPKWMSEMTKNDSFVHGEHPSFYHGDLSSDMIEAMELLVESKTIPLIIQLNDIKRELNLMRMTLNSLVEQFNETNDRNDE